MVTAEVVCTYRPNDLGSVLQVGLQHGIGYHKNGGFKIDSFAREAKLKVSIEESSLIPYQQALAEVCQTVAIKVVPEAPE